MHSYLIIYLRTIVTKLNSFKFIAFCAEKENKKVQPLEAFLVPVKQMNCVIQP